MNVSKIFLALLVFAFAAFGCTSKEEKYSPKYSEQQAMEKAQQELVKTYGEKVLEEKPFIISLHDNLWKISGTLHCQKSGKTCLGGVAHITISAEDGSVKEIIHDK